MIIDLDFKVDNLDEMKLFYFLDNKEIFKHFINPKVTDIKKIKNEFGARSTKVGSNEVSYVRKNKEFCKPKISGEGVIKTKQARCQRSREEVNNIWYGDLI